MQLSFNHIRLASSDARHVTELRFDSPVVISVLHAATAESDVPEFDLKMQDVLAELLKASARKLHGNLSTGLVMKEPYNKGIGLRGLVSEAMVLAIGNCLIEAGLLERSKRESFAETMIRQRVVYGAKKGLEGMAREPNLPMIQALSNALLHDCAIGILSDAHYAEAWRRIKHLLQEITAKEGDFMKLLPDDLATLEMAGRANLDYITDQTAWAIVDIAKKSEFTIRNATKATAGMESARSKAVKALGGKPKPPERSVLKKLFSWVETRR